MILYDKFEEWQSKLVYSVFYSKELNGKKVTFYCLEND
jgi:hypothetical protein